MQCPIDGTQLLIAERSGVEIDYCPQCRGIWLDRGELEKLMERANEIDVREARMYNRPESLEKRKRDYDDDYYDDDDYRRYPRKRKTFMKELFDIFD